MFWKRILKFLNVELNDKLPIKISVYFVGSVICSCGTALFTLNALGSDAMNTLFTAIAVKTGLMAGDVYTIFNTTMLFLGFLLAKRYTGLGSFLQILIQGFFINTWLRVFSAFPWLFHGFCWKTVIAVASHLCKSLGIALCTSMCLGTAGFEACLFTLADKVKVEYKYFKICSEIIFFVAALFLKGVYGIMTVVEVLFFGPSMSFFMVHLNKTLWKKLGIYDERNNLSRNKRKKITKSM